MWFLYICIFILKPRSTAILLCRLQNRVSVWCDEPAFKILAKDLIYLQLVSTLISTSANKINMENRSGKTHIKKLFLVVGPLRVWPSHPNGLVVRGFTPPHPLRGPTIKKKLFLCVSSLMLCMTSCAPRHTVNYSKKNRFIQRTERGF